AALVCSASRTASHSRARALHRRSIDGCWRARDLRERRRRGKSGDRRQETGAVSMSGNAQNAVVIGGGPSALLGAADLGAGGREGRGSGAKAAGTLGGGAWQPTATRRRAKVTPIRSLRSTRRLSTICA